jgi:hypothetical protein
VAWAAWGVGVIGGIAHRAQKNTVFIEKKTQFFIGAQRAKRQKYIRR